jgi:hypothetical protein
MVVVELNKDRHLRAAVVVVDVEVVVEVEV